MMALFIVVLLNINSYAAVSANDGSAFVTKAEFDALVNTFNEQMDTYQSGLNAKIDGAISNYLAGLSSQSTLNLTDYLKAGYENNVNNVSFYRFNDKTWVTGQDKDDIKVLIYYSYNTGSSNSTSVAGWHGWTIVKNDSTWTRGDYVKYPYKANDSNVNYQDIKYWINLYDKDNPSQGFYFEDYDVHRCAMTGSSEASRFDGTSTSTNPGNYEPTSFTIDLVMNEAGFKSGGTVNLIVTSLTASNWLGHEWKDPNSSYYTKGTQEFLKYMGADFVEDNTTTKIHGVSYSDRNTYNGSEKTIDSMGAEAPASTAYGYKPGTNVSWYNGTTLDTNKKSTNNVIFNVKYKKQKDYNLGFSSYISKYWTGILGTPHRYNAGAVLTNVNKVGKIKYTFKLNKRADVVFMDIPFPNSAIPEKSEYVVGGKTYDHVLKTVEAVKANENTEVEFEKKIINDKVNGDYIYVKVYPLEAADVSTINTVISPSLVIEE